MNVKFCNDNSGNANLPEIRRLLPPPPPPTTLLQSPHSPLTSCLLHSNSSVIPAPLSIGSFTVKITLTWLSVDHFTVNGLRLGIKVEPEDYNFKPFDHLLELAVNSIEMIFYGSLLGMPASLS